MKKLLIISLLGNLFFSCKPYQIPNAVKLESEKKVYVNSYFSDPKTDYIYKAHISIYGNPLSGIFIVKKINDTLHRVALTTDFGNKLLDFEISENSFRVNHILEDLDRKVIVNTLKEDLKILLRTKYPVIQVFETEKHLIYESGYLKRKLYFFENKDDGPLEKLIVVSGLKERVIYYYEPKNNTFAEKIGITHKNINLKIELDEL